MRNGGEVKRGDVRVRERKEGRRIELEEGRNKIKQF